MDYDEWYNEGVTKDYLRFYTLKTFKGLDSLMYMEKVKSIKETNVVLLANLSPKQRWTRKLKSSKILRRWWETSSR